MYSGTEGLKKAGLRCRVCTGCGRCPGVEKIHILTESRPVLSVNLKNEGTERLVTADLGTTTIAMQLHCENGSVEDSYVALNPQAEYGADVISRIAAAKNTEAAEKMRFGVLEELEKGLRRFREKLHPGETLRMILAANTTMTYLLAGWNPEELGRAPFAAQHLEGTEIEVGGVPTYLIPGLSAFVGGDILAGIYACGMLESDRPVLLVDLGTNGEIALGNRKRILVSATAAGPAFEGGVNRGVWGSDMVKFMATLRREGLLDETGLLAEPYFESGIRIGNVNVTQQAIRAVQLAKAAIAAGIEILLQKYGCNYETVGSVILAGGFGYYLNPRDAAEIGLLPRELVGKTVAGGNTALAGALSIGEKMLQASLEQSELLKEEIDIKNRGNLVIEVINLAEQNNFEETYLGKIGF